MAWENIRIHRVYDEIQIYHILISYFDTVTSKIEMREFALNKNSQPNDPQNVIDIRTHLNRWINYQFPILQKSQQQFAINYFTEIVANPVKENPNSKWSYKVKYAISVRKGDTSDYTLNWPFSPTITPGYSKIEEKGNYNEEPYFKEIQDILRIRESLM